MTQVEVSPYHFKCHDDEVLWGRNGECDVFRLEAYGLQVMLYEDIVSWSYLIPLDLETVVLA